MTEEIVGILETPEEQPFRHPEASTELDKAAEQPPDSLEGVPPGLPESTVRRVFPPLQLAGWLAGWLAGCVQMPPAREDGGRSARHIDSECKSDK